MDVGRFTLCGDTNGNIRLIRLFLRAICARVGRSVVKSMSHEVKNAFYRDTPPCPPKDSSLRAVLTVKARSLGLRGSKLDDFAGWL